MSGKDENDEFDIDIEDVCFEIDDDNDDLAGPTRDAGQDFVQSDENKKKILQPTQSSPIKIDDKLNDSNAATGILEVFQETHPGKDNSDNKANDDLSHNFDIEDDEMDLILSQIDENIFEKSVTLNQSTPQKSLPVTSSKSFCEPVPIKISKGPEVSPVNSQKGHGKSPVVKRPAPIRISKGSEVSPVNSEKWHGKSPVKRSFDSETCSFFLSQANTEESPVKRRFPGPAGMLPTLSRNELCKFKKNTYQSPSKNSSLRSPPFIETSNHGAKGLESTIPGITGIVSTNCKTVSKLPLNKNPWKTMLQHLNLNIEDESCLLNNINIGWLKSIKANRIKREDRIRIPFLALVVRENSDLLTTSSIDSNSMLQITLMDATGSIPAYMNANVINTFRKLIFPGTAIVLRNCHLQKLYNELILGVMKKNVMCISVDTGEIEKHADDDGSESSPINPEGFSLHSYENGCGVMLQYTYSTNDIFEELSNLTVILKRTKEDQENDKGKAVINQSKSRLQLFTSVDTTKPSINSGSGGGQLGQPDCGFEDDDDDELFIKALQDFELNMEEENF